jgi:hypothetical protein
MAKPGHEQLFLVGKDVSEADLDAIASEPNKDRARAHLAACMDLDQDEGLPTDIVADLHFGNFLFCHACQFTPEKTSCFLSIMKQVLRTMVSERLDSSQTFELLRTLLLRHSVPRPPWSIAVFSANDLKVVTDYVVNTFFRHFKLYQYVYVPHRQLRLRTKPHRTLPLIPPAHPLLEQHLVDEKAQEELAQHFEKPQRVEDLAAELFSELADRESRIGGEDQRVIAQALERRCAKVLADFDAKMSEQDRELERLIATRKQ